MNEIPNVLSDELKQFFRKIESYLDTTLYFYGSVTRSDYVPNKSDIDVAIFTENDISDINKLQHVLHVSRKEFDKIVWKLNGVMIYGYKIKIEKYNCEICVYNNDFKEILIDEFTKPLKNQSIIIYALLYILKTFYYKIPIIPKSTYTNMKRYIMNDLITKKESVFMLLHK